MGLVKREANRKPKKHVYCPLLASTDKWVSRKIVFLKTSGRFLQVVSIGARLMDTTLSFMMYHVHQLCAVVKHGSILEDPQGRTPTAKRIQDGKNKHNMLGSKAIVHCDFPPVLRFMNVRGTCGCHFQESTNYTGGGGPSIASGDEIAANVSNVWFPTFLKRLSFFKTL